MGRLQPRDWQTVTEPLALREKEIPSSGRSGTEKSGLSPSVLSKLVAIEKAAGAIRGPGPCVSKLAQVSELQDRRPGSQGAWGLGLRLEIGPPQCPPQFCH